MYKYLQDIFSTFGSSTSGKHKSKSQETTHGKSDPFKHNIQDDNSPIYLVLFHMIGCGYCKRILEPSPDGDSPIWTQIQKQNPHVNFIEIERTIYENGEFKKGLSDIFQGQNGEKIIAGLQVSAGYPTLFYVNATNGHVNEIKSPIEVDTMHKLLEAQVKKNMNVIKSSRPPITSRKTLRYIKARTGTRTGTGTGTGTRTRTRTIKRKGGGKCRKCGKRL